MAICYFNLLVEWIRGKTGYLDLIPNPVDEIIELAI